MDDNKAVEETAVASLEEAQSAELDETQLDQVSGGASEVARYKFFEAWPMKAY